LATNTEVSVNQGIALEKEVASSAESVPVQVGTHFFRQQYLFAFATQAEVLQYVRTQTLSDELERLPEIFAARLGVQQNVADLIRREGGIADTVRVNEIPAQYKPKLDSFASDNLFQKTFSHLPVSFGLVEIDKLVAPQRTVNLDYVSGLLARYPKKATLDELLDICVSPKREMEPIQHLEVAPNTHVFSSPNSDIRFLGAFVKELTSQDFEHAVFGGLPAAAVIAFIGYGGAPINVLLSGQRVVLNNGFHRVYALRSIGVTEIPVVIQHVSNPQLEFPPQVVGLPKEYLLGVPRPVVMKDFFEDGFTITLKVRDRVKMITLGIGVNQHDVPA
jgi:hypothetical protein